MEKVKIDGQNYIKLRDFAMLLNGTAGQYGAEFYEQTQTASITTGEPYIPIGDELTELADPGNAPLGSTPSLVEMMQASAGGKRLETQWKRLANLKVQARVLMFLTSNGIYNDVGKLAAKVEQMHQRQYDVAGRIKDLDRRKTKLKEHLANVDVYNQHKAVHRKYKQLAPKTQAAYYKKHEKEIEQYRAAYQYLKDHLNGRTIIPEKTWRAELAALTAERYTPERTRVLKRDISL